MVSQPQEANTVQEVEDVRKVTDIFLPRAGDRKDLLSREDYEFYDEDFDDEGNDIGMSNEYHNLLGFYLDNDTVDVVNAVCNAITAKKDSECTLTLNLSPDTEKFLTRLEDKRYEHQKSVAGIIADSLKLLKNSSHNVSVDGFKEVVNKYVRG